MGRPLDNMIWKKETRMVRDLQICVVIGGKVSPHNTTLVSPDHSTHNQIDCLCITEKSRKSTETTHADFPVVIIPPTIEEIRMAIRQIKSGKLAGPENIPLEALKSDMEATANMLDIALKKSLKKEKC
ncbi:unnamed protein product [Schistosoma mattheei]|uniref:Uncharacterized protein n=1 Tax=Schistosoma mattheei TaxID=31246 RepID=A0A183NU63_9TREM|nr:unnamed protein product [Schistosoma mattheei]